MIIIIIIVVFVYNQHQNFFVTWVGGSCFNSWEHVWALLSHQDMLWNHWTFYTTTNVSPHNGPINLSCTDFLAYFGGKQPKREPKQCSRASIVSTSILTPPMKVFACTILTCCLWLPSSRPLIASTLPPSPDSDHINFVPSPHIPVHRMFNGSKTCLGDSKGLIHVPMS